jgi:hypothetical protein
MYGGYIEGGPTEKDNEHHTNRAIVLAKTYYKHLEPIIYRGNLEEGKVLPYVANIAWLDNLEQQMMLIWFTNGEKDIIESLGDIIDDIDWKKNSTEYCF